MTKQINSASTKIIPKIELPDLSKYIKKSVDNYNKSVRAKND
jgi:hypothetical protein